MADHVSAATGCLLVGEYVDEAECPTTFASHRGEVVRPQVVANFVDLWGRDDGLREFTVLLKDGPTLSIRGHGLKCEKIGAEHYSVFVRTPTEEVVVALFKAHDVLGIFHGAMRVDRKTA
jgi:hypothetical protein